MDIQISYYTSQGQRTHNEDTLSVMEGSQGVLAMVADGLGGHQDGQLASRQAVATVNAALQSQVPDEKALEEAVCQANGDIEKLQAPGRRIHTTLCALWFGKDIAIAAHVGDSRIYQFRSGRIIFQTMDHSLAQTSVLLGDMMPSEVRYSRDRNKLTRALGSAENPKVDCKTLRVLPGDRFLLCSDGFWEPVTEERMVRSLMQTDSLQAWLEAMYGIVQEREHPKQDNHTAIALEVRDSR